MAGLGANAVQPAPHRWIRDEVEAALFGDVGIGIEGDVGDRVALGRKPVRVAEMMFHDGESMLAAHLVGGYAVDEAGGRPGRRRAPYAERHRRIVVPNVLPAARAVP